MIYTLWHQLEFMCSKIQFWKDTVYSTGTKKMVFWRFSAKVHVGTQQTYWEVLLLKGVLKNTGRVCQYMISILLRYVLQKYWKSFLKHAKRLKITVKITEIFPAKILKSILWRRVLQNHQEESCRNVRSCSAKILKGVLQNWWG